MTPITPDPSRPSMRAAVYRRFGDPEVVEVVDVPRPRPRRGEVLIRVAASTVSMADYRARSKDVPPGLALLSSVTLGFRAPRIRTLGMDAAGVVEEVGEGVDAFRPGDEVLAMLGAAFGGHAEYATIAADGPIVRKSRNLSFEEAAALVFGGITAQAFLRQAEIRPGSRVLVNGASGAVGSAAVQLAKEAGAQVTAVCSARNIDLARTLGADRVIDYAAVDFAAEGVEYDVILDAVGNAPFQRSESLLRPGGALLLVVTDLAGVLKARSRTRSSGKRVITGTGRYEAEDLAFLVRLAEEGRLRPLVEGIYGLDDIVAAHRFVDGGRKRGSVVVRIGSPIAPTSSTHTESSATEGHIK